VQWAGRRAVVTLPEHIDVSNAGQISERLLSIINRGAAELIADMTATASCDYAGADAVVRAYQRAAASVTQLRLVVTAEIVRRVLTVNGLDRLISIYPSLDAATAAGASAAVVPPAARQATGDGQAAPQRAAGAWRQQLQAGPVSARRTAVITPTVLGRLVDALADGVALVGDDGVLALVNRRAEEMFGYEHAELTGQLVESLIPADLRAAHRGYRAGYVQEPRTRPMGAGARLVGLRKDGATFPVQVSLSPVPTASGHLTLAVIRDLTEVQQRADLIDIARAAIAVEQEHHSQEVLDRVTDSLLAVGLSLEAAIDQPSDVAREHITEALRHLDEAIREIRDHRFATRHRGAAGLGSG